MSKKMTKYVKEFVGTKPVEMAMKDVVLHIGQECEIKGYQSSLPPRTASKTTMDLLVGAKILERPTGTTFSLTEERGKEIYKSVKKEVLEKEK